MPVKPLRICIVTNEFPALTETFITTKALELSKRGHQITVIKNQHNSAAINSSHIKLVKAAGIQIRSSFSLQSGKSLLKAVGKKPGLFLKSLSLSPTTFKRNFKSQLQQQLFQHNEFDIVHFEFSGLAIAYRNELDKIKCKVVVSCRGTAEKVKPITEPQRKAQLSNLFAKVDAIHCVSDDMANTIKPYTTGNENIFVNRPSIDPLVFKRTKPYADNNSTLKILTIGRFTFQKGYLLGLLAIKELKEQQVNFTWIIVGDGPQHEEMMYHVHALGLQEHVQLVGKKNRDEILTLFNEVDVFMLPSVYEGIANVCLEAMSMELPVVSTKSGGMEEVIVHGENGLLCEVYDPSSIANNLIAIATDFNKRNHLGTNARQTVLDHFTIERQANVFEAEYTRLVNA
jgi:colanic acid/amylovoran biosynthesis glycosyltransferase